MATFITRTGQPLLHIAELPKQHIRITGNDDDYYLEHLIATATEWAEEATDCILVPSTVVETFNCPAYVYNLTKQPVTSITSVEYHDGEDWQPFTNYKTRIYQHGYSSVYFNTIPECSREANEAIRITYQCALTRQLSAAKHLVCMIAAQLWLHREIEVTGQTIAKVQGCDQLVANLRPGGAY